MSTVLLAYEDEGENSETAMDILPIKPAME